MAEERGVVKTEATAAAASSTITNSISRTPHNVKDTVFKTPATLRAAPFHTTSALPPPSPAMVFKKTPKPPKREARFIHTNSPLVTDV